MFALHAGRPRVPALQVVPVLSTLPSTSSTQSTYSVVPHSPNLVNQFNQPKSQYTPTQVGKCPELKQNEVTITYGGQVFIVKQPYIPLDITWLDKKLMSNHTCFINNSVVDAKLQQALTSLGVQMQSFSHDNQVCVDIMLKGSGIVYFLDDYLHLSLDEIGQRINNILLHCKGSGFVLVKRHCEDGGRFMQVQCLAAEMNIACIPFHDADQAARFIVKSMSTKSFRPVSESSLHINPQSAASSSSSTSSSTRTCNQDMDKAVKNAVAHIKGFGAEQASTLLQSVPSLAQLVEDDNVNAKLSKAKADKLASFFHSYSFTQS